MISFSSLTFLLALGVAGAALVFRPAGLGDATGLGVTISTAGSTVVFLPRVFFTTGVFLGDGLAGEAFVAFFPRVAFAAGFVGESTGAGDTATALVARPRPPLVALGVAFLGVATLACFLGVATFFGLATSCGVSTSSTVFLPRVVLAAALGFAGEGDTAFFPRPRVDLSGCLGDFFSTAALATWTLTGDSTGVGSGVFGVAFFWFFFAGVVLSVTALVPLERLVRPTLGVACFGVAAFLGVAVFTFFGVTAFAFLPLVLLVGFAALGVEGAGDFGVITFAGACGVVAFAGVLDGVAAFLGVVFGVADLRGVFFFCSAGVFLGVFLAGVAAFLGVFLAGVAAFLGVSLAGVAAFLDIGLAGLGSAMRERLILGSVVGVLTRLRFVATLAG